MKLWDSWLEKRENPSVGTQGDFTGGDDDGGYAESHADSRTDSPPPPARAAALAAQEIINRAWEEQQATETTKRFADISRELEEVTARSIAQIARELGFSQTSESASETTPAPSVVPEPAADPVDSGPTGTLLLFFIYFKFFINSSQIILFICWKKGQFFQSHGVPDYFPAQNRSEALMWTWVSLVARVLPDWALQSLDVIIHDPGFNPKDLTNPLLNLCGA